MTDNEPADILYLSSLLVEATKRAQSDLIRLKTICGHPIYADVQSFLSTMAMDDENYVRDAADYDAKCAFLGHEIADILASSAHAELASRFAEVSLALNRRWPHRGSLVDSMHKQVLVAISALARSVEPLQVQTVKMESEGPEPFEGWALVCIEDEPQTQETMSPSFRPHQLTLEKGLLTVSNASGKVVVDVMLGSHLSIQANLVAQRQFRLEPLLTLKELAQGSTQPGTNVPLEEWIRRFASHMDWIRNH